MGLPKKQHDRACNQREQPPCAARLLYFRLSAATAPSPLRPNRFGLSGVRRHAAHGAVQTMIHKGIQFSFEQTATPDIWSWQYRIGHHIKTGRLKAPSRKAALRGVHRKIDHDLRDIYLRTSVEYQRSC